MIWIDASSYLEIERFRNSSPTDLLRLQRFKAIFSAKSGVKKRFMFYLML
jgi:hypothetical protein